MAYMQLIGFGFLLISLVVGRIFRSKFTKYANTPLGAGLSGAEIAERMLHDSGIFGVHIVSTPGKLSDHYNPLTRTVNLSHDVYHGRNTAAAAVAAHECGHAVQHAQGYLFLRFRSAMVPALSITTRFMPWVVFLGISAINTTLVPLQVGIVLFSLTTLFSIVTLPVEFDASRRALAWMYSQRMTTRQEQAAAKDALWWAAMTYVVAALGSIAQLLHLMNLLNRRRD